LNHRNPEMRILFNRKFLRHNTEAEEEGTYRIRQFASLGDDEEYDGEPYLPLVHPLEYIESIKKACTEKKKIAEIQLSPHTWESVKTAVGLTIKASERGDFAVVRPPGHHAGRASYMGFCLFNNIAIAAQKLVNQGKKVFILDIDAHHGNGTQDIFYAENKVFYCSIHQAFSFPFTGQRSEKGIGPGEGYTLNVPLMIGCGDKSFLRAVDQAIYAARQFNPDVVGISAGFDGYVKDKMMNLDYSLKAFYETGFKLARAFKNIFAVLEGGYHDDIFECVNQLIEGIHVGSRPVRNRFDHDMSVG
jgi:acetoin utilization deacetylase AcuC-like enzyme